MKDHTTGWMPELSCQFCCVKTHHKKTGSPDSFKLTGVKGARGKMNPNVVDRINYRHPALHHGAIHEADIAYFDAGWAQYRQSIIDWCQPRPAR
jgi:hypothetical protein